MEALKQPFGIKLKLLKWIKESRDMHSLKNVYCSILRVLSRQTVDFNQVCSWDSSMSERR